GPVDVADAPPAVRGAPGAHPVRGTGRGRRAPARLGAADAGHDPAGVLAPGDGHAGPGAGARAALVALRPRPRRAEREPFAQPGAGRALGEGPTVPTRPRRDAGGGRRTGGRSPARAG